MQGPMFLEYPVEYGPKFNADNPKLQRVVQAARDWLDNYLPPWSDKAPHCFIRVRARGPSYIAEAILRVGRQPEKILGTIYDPDPPRTSWGGFDRGWS